MTLCIAAWPCRWRLLCFALLVVPCVDNAAATKHKGAWACLHRAVAFALVRSHPRGPVVQASQTTARSGRCSLTSLWHSCWRWAK